MLQLPHRVNPGAGGERAAWVTAAEWMQSHGCEKHGCDNALYLACLRNTIRTGKTHFWSRSRQKYWMKGESSGHTQEVRAIRTDCDKDTLVIEVVQHGAACHEGYGSCFCRRLTDDGEWEITDEKLFDPDGVYRK